MLSLQICMRSPQKPLVQVTAFISTGFSLAWVLVVVLTRLFVCAAAVAATVNRIQALKNRLHIYFFFAFFNSHFAGLFTSYHSPMSPVLTNLPAAKAYP